MGFLSRAQKVAPEETASRLTGDYYFPRLTMALCLQ